MCFYSHAIVLIPTSGYNTATFLARYLILCNTYSSLGMVVTDHKSNLVVTVERPIWRTVAEALGFNTGWKFTHKGCPWWHGQVERVVGMAKRMLHNLQGTPFQGTSTMSAACVPGYHSSLILSWWLLSFRQKPTSADHTQ